MMEKEEALFIETAEREHIEMYLKAIWMLNERGEEAKVSIIAKVLGIKQPSVVQMLRKLHRRGYVMYANGKAELTDKGSEIGRQMVRNSRLLEVLMKNALRIDLDEEMVCGMEHHMSKRFADAICTLLNHPRICPHGYAIPEGICCKNNIG
ncbi:MAG: metal-dependent transcriptional regulator [Candidatus Nitrosocaldus sp.]